MGNFFKLGSAVLILCLALTVAATDLVSTKTLEGETVTEAPTQPSALLQEKENIPPQRIPTCKQTSSVSELWIKKNYKNCKKCGVFRNRSQKIYYCYCDC